MEYLGQKLKRLSSHKSQKLARAAICSQSPLSLRGKMVQHKLAASIPSTQINRHLFVTYVTHYCNGAHCLTVFFSM